LIIDCHELKPKQLYQILIGSVLPRPIAWVSTKSKDGVNNLAPFSFFNIFSMAPPILGFAPGLKHADPGSVRPPKDTLRNIIDTLEFVVNTVSLNLAEKMNQTSGEYPHNVSEFEAAGLTPVASQLVKPPRVGECLISMECKLFQAIKLGDSTLILGEILSIHLDESVLTEDGLINLDILQPIGRLGGDGYSTVADRFEILRPRLK
jgi:flavin reductase (DIM6/NTAB) family NADH-FMN oxidoreductase RutF